MENAVFFIAGSVFGGSFSMLLYCCLRAAAASGKDDCDAVPTKKR